MEGKTNGHGGVVWELATELPNVVQLKGRGTIAITWKYH
jgi:hypothetical protein